VNNTEDVLPLVQNISFTQTEYDANKRFGTCQVYISRSGATGFGVRLIVDLVMNWQQS